VGIQTLVRVEGNESIGGARGGGRTRHTSRFSRQIHLNSPSITKNASNRANKGTYRKTRSTAAVGDEDEWPPLNHPSRSSSPTLHEENEAEGASLHSILSEIKDFR